MQEAHKGLLLLQSGMTGETVPVASEGKRSAISDNSSACRAQDKGNADQRETGL